MKLPNPLETVARSSPKVKLALGAAGLFLFIVGVKRSLPKRDETTGHTAGPTGERSDSFTTPRSPAPP
ncbi:hypothetical protein BH23GEM4_BH23GEM4_18850 [soil metagenome]